MTGLGGEPTAAHNSFSGEGVGAVVQAGVVHGDIHVHSPRAHPQVPVPRQLLAPSPRFTGRQAEIRALNAARASSARTGSRCTVVLNGPGGIGKTALALHWAHQVREEFPDGQLHVDLAGFGVDRPVLPTQALGMFLRALGVPPGEVPVELPELAALYRSRTAGRSLLVLLDNALSAAQVRLLLPSSPTSLALVTSRNRLASMVVDGASLLDLGPLEPTGALRLLTSTIGEQRVTAQPEQAQRLVQLCGGLPIAMCVAAARLAAHPRWSVRRAVEELTDEHSRVSNLSRSAELSVTTTLDLSYRALPARTARLYRQLALHPGRTFGAEVVGALDAEADPVLEELVEGNLIEEIGEDRYRFHDLLQLYARQQAGQDGDEERDGALRAVLEWYLAKAREADLAVTPHRRRLAYAPRAHTAEVSGFADREAALTWLELERVNLVAASRSALVRQWAELAWQLCDVLWPLFLHHKHYSDRAEVDQRGVDAARAWGNAFAEADMLKRLGRVCTVLGRYAEAEDHFRAAAALAGEIGDERGVADAREGMALLYRDRGDLASAIELFRELAARNRELGAQRSLGLVLINLGAALCRTDRTGQALPLLAEAGDLLGALTPPDRYNQARAAIVRGRACLSVGEAELAENTARSALAAMRELDSVHGQAEAHEVLAEVARQRGDHATAAHHLRHALDLLSSIHSPQEDAARARLALLDRAEGQAAT
ncbi:tetratricopeptide repeat protein [Kutzneria viridogrisea]|uniref:Tetratricopeptide (TPR) repeat protein n=1 Tax=Kutzneria viridogrisea TaxID=47990 RepID=A0ABR6BW51_9PSEU|nr:tetratricopeptide (TPR) repeat protein [Kutzneria viridogrisea]